MAVGDRKLFSYRTGDLMGDLAPADKWTMQDALGSVSCTTDGSGAILSVECYYAFGETAFGSYTKKRYRYCGKERDGETGLYYYGARYYDAWTCRFVSADPLADKYAYLSPYNYAGNNPISYMDVDGMQSEANEKSPSGGGGEKSGNSQTGPQNGTSNVNTTNVLGYWFNNKSGEVTYDTKTDKQAKAEGLTSFAGGKEYLGKEEFAPFATPKSSGYGSLVPGWYSKPQAISPIAKKMAHYAQSYLKLAELTHNNDHPVIDSMLALAGAPKREKWCGAFTNWVTHKSDLQGPKVPARALSWRDWGTKLDRPAFFSVATLIRKGGGHVGFVAAKDADREGWIVLLGGNQSDSVSYRSYPLDTLKFNFPSGHTPTYNLPSMHGVKKGMRVQ